MVESYIDEQTLTRRFACVDLPADAIESGPWQPHGDDDWRRHFLTREWNLHGLSVRVAGQQDSHGDVTRWMHVGGEDHCTSSDRLGLITALVDAGELLHMLNVAG